MSKDTSASVPETIHGRLRAARKRTDITQKDVANYFGIKQSAVSKWENGKTEITVSYLEYAVKEYGVSADWLLTGEDPESKNEKPPLVDFETTKLLTKAQAVLVSDNKPLVDSLTQSINSYFELVKPAQQITAEQAFDIVANKLVFVCSNPDCGKEVGSFTDRKKLSDVCPFCGEVTHAKTFAKQIAALRVQFSETDDIDEIRRKIMAETSPATPRKAKNDSH